MFRQRVGQMSQSTARKLENLLQHYQQQVCQLDAASPNFGEQVLQQLRVLKICKKLQSLCDPSHIGGHMPIDDRVPGDPLKNDDENDPGHNPMELFAFPPFSGIGNLKVVFKSRRNTPVTNPELVRSGRKIMVYVDLERTTLKEYIQLVDKLKIDAAAGRINWPPSPPPSPKSSSESSDESESSDPRLPNAVPDIPYDSTYSSSDDYE